MDAVVLNKVNDLRNNQAFKNALGSNWESELTEIINKNASLKCPTCSGGFAYRQPMQEFLSDMEYYVTHYDISSNGIGNKFYQWAKRVSVDETSQLSDGLGIIDETYQTLAYIRAKNLSNIQSFGQKFPNGTRQYDLFFGAGKFTELKNANFVGMTSLPSQYVDQVIEGYFANISSLDDFKWVACGLKLKDKGWDNAKALAELKGLWKQAFNSRSNEFFNAMNSDFKNQLGLVGINAKSKFDLLIDDVNSQLYNFIKVE